MKWESNGHFAKGHEAYGKLSSGESAFHRVVRNYKKNAVNRELLFSLTEDECRQLFTTNCHYCDAPPTNVCKEVNGTFVYSGIDRVSNTEGYTPENCVPCCKPCNMMKKDLSREEFIARCQKITCKFSEKA